MKMSEDATVEQEVKPNNIARPKVLKTRVYKAGYKIVDTHYPDYLGMGEPYEEHAAYTHDDLYIGDPKWAYTLCKKYGIKPELSHPGHKVCSIGFSSKDQKWYGWSHRAFFGFGIGSEVKPGDCAFKPSNPTEFMENTRSWYDSMYPDARYEVNDDGIVVYSNDNSSLGIICHYPDVWGRGAWTAASLDDAKEMAIDFADGVG